MPKLPEVLSLRAAQARVSHRSAGQQDVVARCHALGWERMRAAQSLFADDATSRLSLLRDAGTCFLAAALADVGEAVVVGDLDAGRAWSRFDAQIASNAFPRPPGEAVRARRWLASSRPLDLPREPGETAALVADAVVTVRWLSQRVEPRPADMLRRARRRRVLAACIAAVLAPVGLLAVALAPTNIALGKPVQPSSSVEKTTGSPEGLTNGLVEFTFGTETDVEDSPSFTVDLGRPEPIDRVVVYNRGDRNPADNLPLALDVGDDTAELQTVATRTTSFSRTRPWVVRGLRRTVRYVRVRKTVRGALFLGEIEVYR